MATNGVPDGNGVVLKAPGGFAVAATGPLAVLIVVLVAGFSSLGFILYDGFKVQVAEHTALMNAQNDLACVLALPAEARSAAIVNPYGICHYARTIFYTIPPERRR